MVGFALTTLTGSFWLVFGFTVAAAFTEESVTLGLGGRDIFGLFMLGLGCPVVGDMLFLVTGGLAGGMLRGKAGLLTVLGLAVGMLGCEIGLLAADGLSLAALLTTMVLLVPCESADRGLSVGVSVGVSAGERVGGKTIGVCCFA